MSKVTGETTCAMLGASLADGAQAEECGQFFRAPGCHLDDCAPGGRPGWAAIAYCDRGPCSRLLGHEGACTL